MSDAAERHREQVESWNGPGGQQWIANEARTERALAPVTAALLEAAAAQPGETVLDIGCGCGGSTFAFARAVGPTGRVIGADVSEPILAVARANTVPPAEFILADAAAHDFPAASVDLLASRFGVMFFGDPDAAFARLRRAMKPTGRVAFACWRPLADNPWAMLPLKAILPMIPTLPRPGPEDPGPFAFGDPARVTRILTAGGFAAPQLEKFDFMMRTPGDANSAAELIAGGPVAGRALREQPPDIRAAAIKAVAAAVAPHIADGFATLGASIWLVTTRPA